MAESKIYISVTELDVFKKLCKDLSEARRLGRRSPSVRSAIIDRAAMELDKSDTLYSALCKLYDAGMLCEPEH